MVRRERFLALREAKRLLLYIEAVINEEITSCVQIED